MQCSTLLRGRLKVKEWDYENDQWTKLPVHLKHLPLFTRNFDLLSYLFRVLWWVYLKLAFTFYIRLKVVGSYKSVYKNHPRLLVISNHGSHLDAVSIAASIPFYYWRSLFIAAAKDYFFSNSFFRLFSQHCLGAIPIDRKDKKGEAVELCLNLLSRLGRIWLILFPEGTRSPDGKLQKFKRGIGLFSEQTSTPVLFLYVDGNSRLWPKGAFFARPGKLTIYVGPVHPPSDSETIQLAYKEWAKTVNPELKLSEDFLGNA